MKITVIKLGSMIALSEVWSEDDIHGVEVLAERMQLLESIHDRINFGLVGVLRYEIRNGSSIIYNLK